MNKELSSCNFSERLRRLYSDNGIDVSVRGWAAPVASEYFTRGIIEYDDTGKGLGVNANRDKKRDSIKTQLLRHVTNNLSVEEVNTVWILRYSKYFGCSVAYLLGEIEHPTIEQTDTCKVTGLSPAAVKTLIQYQKTAPIDKQFRENFLGDSAPAAAYSLLVNTVNFLLRPEHCEPNKAGLLHLIGHYIVSDDLHPSPDLPEVLQTENYNGSGITFDTAEVLRSAIPNMIRIRLDEYRAERLRNRKKPRD